MKKCVNPALAGGHYQWWNRLATSFRASGHYKQAKKRGLRMKTRLFGLPDLQVNKTVGADI